MKSFREKNKKYWRAGKKQEKGIKNRIEQQFLSTDKKSIASLFLKASLNEETTYDLNNIVKIEYKLNKDYLIYKTGNNKKDKIYDFQQFIAIRCFGKKIVAIVSQYMIHFQNK